MTAITIHNLRRFHAGSIALDGVDLATASGELVALLGPSGSGKTSLLRIIAGLDAADAGTVRFDGRNVSARPATRRRVGYVFQDHALFRHMDVAANIGFGLAIRPRAVRPGRAEIAGRVAELLTLVRLPGIGARYPDQLSGGERQRVALARALATDPAILLLDEPFGALDAIVRRELRAELRVLHERLGLTTILVTHDASEALALADRIAVIDRGRIVQVATPEALLDAPASASVHELLGESNRLEVAIDEGVALFEGRPLAIEPGAKRGRATLMFRPHDVRLVEAGGIIATVSDCRRLGGGYRIEARTGGGAVLTLDLQEAAEADAEIVILPSRFHLFD